MASTAKEHRAAREAERADGLSELKPWREVGWIFRDGQVVAIERKDDSIRVRKVEEQ